MVHGMGGRGWATERRWGVGRATDEETAVGYECLWYVCRLLHRAWRVQCRIDVEPYGFQRLYVRKRIAVKSIEFFG